MTTSRGRDGRPAAADRAARSRDGLETLTALANELAGEFRLRPLLQRILLSATELLDCTSGSICLIDQAEHTYRKEIDLDDGCHAGRSFPLDEGVTGAVARAGGTVIFDSYADVPFGHIDADEPRYTRGVIGVPIRLNAELIGAVIVFAGAGRAAFDDEDASLLQRFAIHAAIAMANARLHEEAANRAKQVAVSAERERSMLEVHDTIGRGLAALMVRLREAQQLASRGQDVTAALVRAQRAVNDTLDEGRRAVMGLGPALLEGRSIDEAIQLELDWACATAGVETSFRVFGSRRDVVQEVSLQLIRIVQECLANVAQHAEAKSVRVGLVFGTDGVAVIVEDDGIGFDVASVDLRGVGLAGLVARAAQVGGRLHIDSTPGWGTRIRADLPWESSPRNPENPRLRVLVAHDQPAMLAGLVRLIAHAEPGVHVVAEVSEFAAAVDAARLLRPDVVVAGMRVATPEATLVRALREVDPDVAVVAVNDDPAAEADMRAWAGDGVRGFVQRDVDATSLGRAVMAAARGDALVFGELLERLGGAPVVDPNRLTHREFEVRRLLGQGLADKQISSRLGISVKTVEKHVGSILRKESVRSRVELLVRPS